MKAVEFVKKFGWGEFKDLYQASLYVEPFQPPSEKIIGIKKSEIKELFDAFDLVEKVGGLYNAKTFDESCMYCIAHITTLDNLQKAVKLVEQCQ